MKKVLLFWILATSFSYGADSNNVSELHSVASTARVMDVQRLSKVEIINETNKPQLFSLVWGKEYDIVYSELHFSYPDKQINLVAPNGFDICHPQFNPSDRAVMNLGRKSKKLTVKTYSTIQKQFLLYMSQDVRLEPGKAQIFSCPMEHYFVVGCLTESPYRFNDLWQITFPNENSPLYIISNIDLIRKTVPYDRKTGVTFDQDRSLEGWVGPYIDRFNKEFFNKSVDQIAAQREDLLKASDSVLHDVKSGASVPETPFGFIPKIMHKVWVTSEETPYEPPVKRVDLFLKTAREQDDLLHIFWHTEKAPLTYLREELAKQNLKNVEIRSLSNILPQFKAKALFYRFYQDKRYTLCSDIARFNLMYLLGGVYSDLGVSFYIKLSPLLNSAGYISFWDAMMHGTTVIGSPPKHIVFEKFLTFIDQIFRVPEKYRHFGEKNHLAWCSVSGLSCFVDEYLKPIHRPLILPADRSVFSVAHMGSYVNMGSFGQTSNYKNPLKITDYFGSVDPTEYPFNNSGWLESTSTIAKNIYGLNEEQRVQKRIELSQTSKQHFYRLQPGPKRNSIPHITHRIWLTNVSNPIEPNDALLKHYLNSLYSFSSLTDMKHIFWCQNKNLLPKTIKTLETSPFPIEVREVSEILDKIQPNVLFKRLIEEKYFTFASDLLRYNLLYLFGGLYTDLGISYNFDFSNIMEEFDYIFIKRENAYLDIGLLGAPQFSILFKTQLETLGTLSSWSKQRRALFVRGEQQITLTGCNHMMAIIDGFLKSDIPMIFLPFSQEYLPYLRVGNWQKSKENLQNTGHSALVDLNLFSYSS